MEKYSSSSFHFNKKIISLNSNDFIDVNDVNSNVTKIDVDVVMRTSTPKAMTLKSVFEGTIPPPNKCVMPYATNASITSLCDAKFRCHFELCGQKFNEEYQLW